MQHTNKLFGAAALALGLALMAAPAQAQQSRLESNAYKRCEAHSNDTMCRARVRGGEDVRITGSVPGGGLFRENLLSSHAYLPPAKPVHMTWDRRANLTTWVRVPGHGPYRDPARWHN